MDVYTTDSPYYTTSQTSWYLDVWNFRDIPPDSTDTTLTLARKYTHRPDLLAYDLYGKVEWDWVFTIRNPDVIRDKIWDFVAGITIYVPTKERLQSILGTST